MFAFFSTILQSEDMEEEQAHTCIDIDDGDATATTVDDNADVDDETFNMDDGMQLIVYTMGPYG